MRSCSRGSFGGSNEKRERGGKGGRNGIEVEAGRLKKYSIGKLKKAGTGPGLPSSFLKKRSGHRGKRGRKFLSIGT